MLVTDKDRLLRFGSELIFALCENNGTEVIILNKPVEQEPEQELVEDDKSGDYSDVCADVWKALTSQFESNAGNA